MSKVTLLREKTKIFRRVILKLSAEDPDLALMLEPLMILFDAIEKGEVIAPAQSLYRSPFHMEDPRYGMRSEFYEALAEFLSALEDWPAKFRSA